MTLVLINIGFFLVLVALAVKDVLRLRSILLISQLCLLGNAFVTSNVNTAFWYILFLLINTVNIILLLKERRPVDLPPELVDLHENVFSVMTNKEFLYFWNTGQAGEAENEILVRQGKPMDTLSLVLTGTVDVIKDGKIIAQLGRGSFFAEMSFLTGEPASADIKAGGKVEYMSWEQEKLHCLKQLDSNQYIKLQNILGKDLSAKVKLASAKI
ncbi:cyclic nucleotide-binding domain-containing protein [Pontiellaceae bacterium B1224]|nr:cyclic nucleotide-binding domain-containing protein [Pontiellaceae bacterium B1224]